MFERVKVGVPFPQGKGDQATQISGGRGKVTDIQKVVGGEREEKKFGSFTFSLFCTLV